MKPSSQPQRRPLTSFGRPHSPSQEVFNSPYAVSSFRTYAEPIPTIDSFKTATLSESVAMLSAVAKAGVWLVGGASCRHATFACPWALTGRIPLMPPQRLDP
jgi:hypothetical protein